MSYWTHSHKATAAAGGSGNTHTADFDRASSQHATLAVGGVTGLNMTGDRTIEFYAQFDDVPGNGVLYGATGFWAATPTTARNWMIFFQGTGSGNVEIRAYTRLAAATASIKWQVTDYITITNWNRYSLAFDISEAQASEWTLYTNGTDRGNGAIQNANNFASTTAATTGSFYVANWAAANRHFNGQIDDVRVWDDLRTAGEIAAAYNSELIGDEANLQGYWKLNNDWTDSSANSNALSPQNGPAFQSGDLPF